MANVDALVRKSIQMSNGKDPLPPNPQNAHGWDCGCQPCVNFWSSDTGVAVVTGWQKHQAQS